jgi:hypothetical protein
MKHFFFIFFGGLLPSLLTAQNNIESQNFKFLNSEYPEGIYLSYEDFVEKKSIDYGPFLIRKPMAGFKEMERNFEADQVFFFNKKNNSKITNAFAISYNGSVYIQQRQIHNLTSKDDRNQEGDNPNSYHRVTKDGNFLYLEVSFANAWSKGFAYGVGGAAAGAYAATLNKLKGVVFDFNTKEFNLIRDCQDLNTLLSKYNKETLSCEEKKIDILKTREIIDKIIR